MAGFFFTGEQDLTPEGLDRKRVLLNALRKDNLSTAPVGHWTQALARVVGSTADTLEEGQLSRTEKSKTEEARNLLMKHLGIGGAVSPGEPTAAAGVPPSSPAAATPAPKSALPIMAQQDPTAALIRSFEGYRDKPYWDVNAHRVGYGSDTITNPDGSVQKVQPGMQINRQQAELDLQRRISTEFQPRAASAVGENWAKLPPQAQAALTSITYNYGSLPKSVAAAAQSGDPNAIAQAVEGLAGHNGGINANRRMQEAALIRGADMPSQGAQTAEQTLARPAAGQFAIPTQAAQPNAQALMAALSNPWAARSPALMQLAASVAGKQLSRDPVEDALKRVQLQQATRDLTESKPFEIIDPVTNEKITVVRDAQGNVRRLQLAGEPAGEGTPREYQMPDGRKIPLPTNPEARKSMLVDLGKEAAKSVADAPNVVSKMSQGIKTINELIGSPDGKIKEHPGYRQMFGLGRYLPAAPGGSWFDSGRADAEAIVEQLKSQAFLTAVKEMTGMGALSNAEGAKIESAVSRLSTKQSPEAFKAGLRDVQADLERGFRKAQIIANNGRVPSGQAAGSDSGGGWTEISPGVRIREAR